MKTVIEMAREAGLLTIGTADGSEAVYTWPKGITEELERFAELVRAAEREHIAAWMIQRGYSTGHGDTTKDLLDELDWQVVQNWTSAMKTGVETAREACAKVLDEMAEQMVADMEPSTAIAWVRNRAEFIRARGETK
jgi:ribosomal protein L18